MSQSTCAEMKSLQVSVSERQHEFLPVGKGTAGRRRNTSELASELSLSRQIVASAKHGLTRRLQAKINVSLRLCKTDHFVSGVPVAHI